METKKSEYSPFKNFLTKFLKQKVAVVAFFVVLFIVAVGVLAPYIVPYDPTVPVINQYAEKGIIVNGQNTVTVKYNYIYSDGSTEAEGFQLPAQFESANRRVASGRGARDSVTVSAVNLGETYITASVEHITNLLRVVVTRESLESPIITSLMAQQPKAPLEVGDTMDIQLEAILSDGTRLSDLEEISTIIETMETLKSSQNTSGGRMIEEEINLQVNFISLDPNIVTVDDHGRIQGIEEGVGLVQVKLGDLATVVQVPVEVKEYMPVVVGFEFDTRELMLVDNYKHQLTSSMHFFGTDHQNRDIFSRVLVGTRETLMIGFVSVAIGSILGTILGLLAGYYGGWVDSLFTRMSDVLLAFPGILLAIAVIAILGPGLTNIIFAVAVFTVPIFLRIVRSSTLTLKNMTYVEAARSIGVKDSVIIFRHILPGTLSVIIVYLTMRIGTAILIGASLSYLGLGGDITAPEWGAMLNAAKDNSRNVFHPTLFPGLAIVVTVLAFNLLGDGLRDALDPKLKE